MKKIRMKKKKASDKKATKSRSKLDTLISQDKMEDKLNEFDRRLSKAELQISQLEPKSFEPIIKAKTTVSKKNYIPRYGEFSDIVTELKPDNSEKLLNDRYDDVCKEIDKKLK